MLKGLRTLLAFLAVAVFACGNALSVMTEASEHALELHANSAFQFVVHAHGHDHVSDANHAAHLSPSTDTCQGLGCGADEHPGQPCCHVHAHCCVSSVFPPSQLAFGTPSMRRIEQALLASALPVGAVVNPLLRPPRAAV